MSKRRRRKPAYAQKPVKSTPVADEKVVAMGGKDGFVNSLAYLGEASPLSNANDFTRHSISNDYNLLSIMYRENWLAARIIDTPCEDMTRSWYSISSEIDQNKLDELAKLEAKHSVKQEITNAIRWGRLYGGAAAVMVIKGQEDMLDEPLDYDMLQPGCFRGLIVIDRVRGIFPSLELEEDMDDPEFGYPKWYQVTLNEESGEIIRIHHSRLLLFRGRQLPIDEEINQDYWGASELEHVYEELQKRNSSSANIAQLIFQANVATLGISDYGEVMGMGTQQQKQQVYNYVSEMNRLRTSFGIALMSNEDKYEQHPYSFAGVAEVYETFMMDMAGASEIPATKLFGRAPQGMNATGESDMKNYYEVISQLQERILKPALEKLLPVMCMSLWGVVPEDMEIVFEPLGTTTPSERAEIMGQFADPIINAYSAGLISQKVALMELRETGKPINAWTNISDEDIEKADDEPEQGEEMANPMGMPPGMPGMEPQAPQEAAPQPEVDMDKVHELKGRIQALRESQEQPEIDMDKVHELKERIHSMREPEEDGMEEFGDGGDIQVGLEYGDDPQVEHESFGDRIRRLKERVSNLRGKKAEVDPRTEKIRELKARIERIRAKGAEDGFEVQEGMEAPDPDFDESEHPRGSNGRFVPSGGGSSAPVTAGTPGSGISRHVHSNTEYGGSFKPGITQRHIQQSVEMSRGQNNPQSNQVEIDPVTGYPKGFKLHLEKMPDGSYHYFDQDGNDRGLCADWRLAQMQLENGAEFFGGDGGPGSGPPPGYHKKSAMGNEGRPGLMARAKFMANPTEGMNEPKRAPADVQKANKERKEWSNLTMKQRIQGNAAQERHIRKVKREVARAAARGDIDKARAIVKQNRHYWSNDPDSAMKTQSEALKRQKAVKASFLHDALSFLRKNLDGGPGSGNHGHAGRPGQRGGSAPGGGGASNPSSAPIDNGPQAAYNGMATKGWAGLKASTKVGGPKATRKFLRDYLRNNPDVRKEIPKYMGVRQQVANFLTDHPNADNFNTYDTEGNLKNIDHGFCVTFHQNNAEDDPFGGYTDEEYAAMVAIAMKELGADEVNIGYYGNPEVSFVCNDEATAKRFAVEHNQQSIYNANTGRTLKNKQWNKRLNPIRL